MRTWQLPVDKKRQQATQALSKKDENLKHVVSTACRPRVFQIALFFETAAKERGRNLRPGGEYRGAIQTQQERFWA